MSHAEFLQPSDEILRLWEEAVRARDNSYAPYSQYRVGAALRGKDDRVFAACNVENAAWMSVCAERSSILKAVSEGCREFKEIVIVTQPHADGKPTSPCALCLQGMAEFCDPDFVIWSATPEGILGRFLFIELLPHPFGPKYITSKP